MAVSKITSFSAVLLLLLLILLLSTQSSTARREPSFVSGSAEEVEVADTNTEVVGGSCEGAADRDECLMRRTLAAHTDYIYTQKQKP